MNNLTREKALNILSFFQLGYRKESETYQALQVALDDIALVYNIMNIYNDEQVGEDWLLIIDDIIKGFIELSEPQEPNKTEKWNGFHGQITAPKGTFKKILDDCQEPCEDIDRLPSVTQKSGKWIVHPKGIYAHLVCNRCLSNAPYDCETNFCPNCGARMESSDADSD